MLNESEVFIRGRLVSCEKKDCTHIDPAGMNDRRGTPLDHMVITKGFAIITDEIIQLFIVFDVEFIKNLHIIYVCETKKREMD